MTQFSYPLEPKVPPYYSRHPPYHPQCVVAGPYQLQQVYAKGGMLFGLLWIPEMRSTAHL